MALRFDRNATTTTEWKSWFKRVIYVVLITATIAEVEIKVIRESPTEKGVIVFSDITLQPYGGLVYGTRSYGFLVKASIGTPPQDVTLRLTGGVTWVPPREYDYLTSISSSSTYDVQEYGVYNGSQSSTHEEPDPPVLETFNDFLASEGWVTRDRFSFGDFQLSSFPFLAIENFHDFPRLGLGIRDGEHNDTEVNREKGIQTTGFLQAALEEEVIGVKGLAVYLDAYDKNSSQITLGGVDTAKYELPMVTYKWPNVGNVEAGPPAQQVSLIRGNDTIRSVGGGTTYLLFGDPYIRLPAYILTPILQAIGSSQVADGGLYSSCNTLENMDISLKFEFDGINITLTGKDLVGQVGHANSGERCTILLSSSNVNAVEGAPDGKTADIYLGNPFFRVAYVWFDYQNNHTGLARAKQGVGTMNITKIQADGIIATLGEQTLGEQIAPAPTILPSITPEDEMGGSPRSVGPIVGAVVGCVMTVGAIVCLIFWIVIRKPSTPRIPPAPIGELEGHQKFEMFAQHGSCEVGGSGEYPNELPEEGQEEFYRELPANHAFPVELPGAPVLESTGGSPDSSPSPGPTAPGVN